jgi:amino acid permease
MTTNSPTKSSIIFRSAATLGASILGTGVLAQPHTVKETGIVLFILFSFIVVYSSHLTCIFLVRTCEMLKSNQHRSSSSNNNHSSTTTIDPTITSSSTGGGGGFQAEYSTLEDALLANNNSTNNQPEEQSYANIVGQVIGKRGKTLTSLAMIIQQFGACVAYIVVIGDVFTPLIRHWSHHDDIAYWTIRVTVASCCILPLSLFVRELSSLKYTSACAVIAICVFGFTVMINSLEVVADTDKRAELIGVDKWTESKHVHLWPKDSGMIRTIPHFVFAYFVHFNVMQTYNQVLKGLDSTASSSEIINMSNEKALTLYSMASGIAFMISGTITILIGICGYVTFLEEVDSDLLNNFRVQGTYISSVMNVVRALYGVGLILAFPIVQWEARANIFELIARYSSPHMSSSSSSAVSQHDTSYDDLHEMNNNTSSHEINRGVFYGVTILFVAFATLLGCVLSDLGMVFGLVGSTATPTLAFVIPCYVYVNTGAADKYGMKKFAQTMYWVGIVLIVFSVIVYFLDHVGKVWGSD